MELPIGCPLPRIRRSNRRPRTGRASTRPRAIAGCTRACTGSRRSHFATATCMGRVRMSKARPAWSRFSADAWSTGRQPTIYGDGGQTRDWVEVSDVVRANLLAADSSTERIRKRRLGAGDVGDRAGRGAQRRWRRPRALGARIRSARVPGRCSAVASMCREPGASWGGRPRSSFATGSAGRSRPLNSATGSRPPGEPRA